MDSTVVAFFILGIMALISSSHGMRERSMPWSSSIASVENGRSVWYEDRASGGKARTWTDLKGELISKAQLVGVSVEYRAASFGIIVR